MVLNKEPFKFNTITSNENQRLVNMVKEFLWETRNLNREELYALMPKQGFEKSTTSRKALKIMSLISKLIQKYQLEIIMPKLDAII